MMSKMHQYLIAQVLACGELLNTAAKFVGDDELWFKPAPADWNIHQVVAHLRDVQRDIFLPRIAMALKAPGTPVQPFNADAHMQANYSANEPFDKLLGDFDSACRHFAAKLQALDEAQWHCHVQHPKITNMSIEWLAWHTLGHTHEHISQIISNRDQFYLTQVGRDSSFSPQSA